MVPPQIGMFVAGLGISRAASQPFSLLNATTEGISITETTRRKRSLHMSTLAARAAPESGVSGGRKSIFGCVPVKGRDPMLTLLATALALCLRHTAIANTPLTSRLSRNSSQLPLESVVSPLYSLTYTAH